MLFHIMFAFVLNSYKQFQYPKSFIKRAKIKVLKIHKSKYSLKFPNNFLNKSLHRYIILPNNLTTILEIKTVTNSSETIRNLTNDKNNKD